MAYSGSIVFRTCSLTGFARFKKTCWRGYVDLGGKYDPRNKES